MKHARVIVSKNYIRISVIARKIDFTGIRSMIDSIASALVAAQAQARAGPYSRT